MREFNSIEDLQPLVGQEIAVSDWITIDQERINRFAEATSDHQWIHVDPERAKGWTLRHNRGAWILDALAAALADPAGDGNTEY